MFCYDIAVLPRSTKLKGANKGWLVDGGDKISTEVKHQCNLKYKKVLT